MWPIRVVFAIFAASLLLAQPAQATESTAVDMWECSNSDGPTLYTNKERPGCQAMTLATISTVPSWPEVTLRPSTGGAIYEPTPGVPDYAYDTPMGALRNLTQVPDFARDWYAANRGNGSVQAEVCGMYLEWLNITQNSRGGFFFGTDPTYGASPTARNWQAPSYSFYDNTRYLALKRIFGAGFIPIGCH